MRIGIILTGDYSWAGGVYYSLNLIKLLHTISLSKELQIVVIVNSATPPELLKELPSQNIEISYLDKKSFIYRLRHKLRGDRFVADINALHLDILYPLTSYQKNHSKLNCKPFYWLYDFQHKFLPVLFSEEEIKSRDFIFRNIANHAQDIIFSSEDSKKHFEKFYFKSKAKLNVFNFVSLIKKNSAIVKHELNIPQDYYVVCNQFWPHKNHTVVLKALELLLNQNKIIHIVFTGKYDDARNKSYVSELLRFIEEKKLQASITLTGFISREAQISLIKNAKAVIQPSFFEGWSTVVEDAKALNKLMILSDIPVNREQVKENVYFFEPENFVKLSGHINTINEQTQVAADINYQLNIEKAKEDLIRIFVSKK